METSIFENSSNFPNESTRALLNLKYTANWLEKLGNELLKPFDISIQQYNILRILRGAKKAIKINEVRERMIENSPNATRLMDKLCEKGLIERERSENDRRVVFVKINQKGLNLLDQISIEEYVKVMNNLNERELKKLNELLVKLIK
ncbi:MarR family winged helix-turn-helix transcriptional regulator [Namhaeicola litoreus]|uniref:MarR family winged helix-turn-helix transcriptional regulator n=1 Tax=Namhaeicola litoreus TaxID=1052145 RepID=A0ABW3Y3B2_9FLAO